jgi:DNA-binding transcriptional ArsR family regulator
METGQDRHDQTDPEDGTNREEAAGAAGGGPVAGRPPEGSDQDRSRALSSPLRLRILRLCLHEARTNKELAASLGLQPATVLHHVRTLVRTGLLLPQGARTGKRGAREIPYLASRLSWRTPVNGVGPVLIETLLQEIRTVPEDQLRMWRLGVKLNDAQRNRLLERLNDIAEEYAALPADPDGTPFSLFLAAHPEQQPARSGPAAEDQPGQHDRQDGAQRTAVEPQGALQVGDDEAVAVAGSGEDSGEGVGHATGDG